MKTETIKAVFTNLLFVIGVILLIYGFVQGVLTTVRMISFDKYPLNSYEETRCQYSYPGIVTDLPVDSTVPPDKQIPTPANVEAQRKDCMTQVDYERQVRKTEHLATAVSTLIAGSVLVLSFRRFIFR